MTPMTTASNARMIRDRSSARCSVSVIRSSGETIFVFGLRLKVKFIRKRAPRRLQRPSAAAAQPNGTLVREGEPAAVHCPKPPPADPRLESHPLTRQEAPHS